MRRRGIRHSRLPPYYSDLETSSSGISFHEAAATRLSQHVPTSWSYRRHGASSFLPCSIERTSRPSQRALVIAPLPQPALLNMLQACRRFKDVFHPKLYASITMHQHIVTDGPPFTANASGLFPEHHGDFAVKLPVLRRSLHRLRFGDGCARSVPDVHPFSTLSDSAVVASGRVKTVS